MDNRVNWLLLIGGVVCVIVELALGAVTGFDLTLIGGSLFAGGLVGLIAHSEKIGLLSAGILCFVYFALFRNWLKAKLLMKQQPTNVDAVVGRTGTVTRRIAPREAGLIKVGSEEWRAELDQAEEAVRETGAVVTVVSVEGVTLKVR